MRIIAGEFKGRRITPPPGTTARPTTDRVREAVFSSLTSAAGPALGGGAALDLFAGSGALGFEALSRGATAVTFVEKDARVLRALRHNASALGVTQRSRIIAGDAFSLAGRGVLGGPFSLILLDPPYTLDQTAVTRALQGLAESGAVGDGCLVMWEHATGVALAWPDGFVPVTEKRYGSTSVEIARYEGGAGE